MKESQQHGLNALTRMASAVGWEQEDKPGTLTQHNPNNRKPQSYDMSRLLVDFGVYAKINF